MDDIVPHLPLISKIASTVVVVAIAVGLVVRHRPKLHIPIMLGCFVVDVVNVLVIELNRSAIKKTLETATEPGDWLLKFHILVAVLSVVGYLVAIPTGIVLLKLRVGRKLHKLNAGVFLVTRTLNYVTSLFVGA